MKSLESDLDDFGMEEFGDFRVRHKDWEDAAARENERSRAAQRVDQDRRAPITTNYRVWAANPSHYDFPGIDTPRAAPHLLPKDLMTDMYRRSTVNVRTTDAPEFGTKPRVSPLGSDDIAEEHARGRAAYLGLDPLDLEEHAGYYDELERHWAHGRNDVEPQDEVPEPFRGHEGRERPHELGAWSRRGILQTVRAENGSRYATRR